MVRYKFHKVLLINNPINNTYGLSILVVIILGIKDTSLTTIQVLYSRLICNLTLGFYVIFILLKTALCIIVDICPNSIMEPNNNNRRSTHLLGGDVTIRGNFIVTGSDMPYMGGHIIPPRC